MCFDKQGHPKSREVPPGPRRLGFVTLPWRGHTSVSAEGISGTDHAESDGAGGPKGGGMILAVRDLCREQRESWRRIVIAPSDPRSAPADASLVAATGIGHTASAGPSSDWSGAGYDRVRL